MAASADNSDTSLEQRRPRIKTASGGQVMSRHCVMLTVSRICVTLSLVSGGVSVSAVSLCLDMSAMMS